MRWAARGAPPTGPNDITGAVLEKNSSDKATAAQAELPLEAPPVKPVDGLDAGGVVYMTQPLNRPEELPGQTYKIKWAESEHAIYITINDIVQDGRRRPFEVFHQFQKYGALRLDRRPDPDDQRRLPARR